MIIVLCESNSIEFDDANIGIVTFERLNTYDRDRGRAVKATDSKSVIVMMRRFESCRSRHFFCIYSYLTVNYNTFFLPSCHV